MAAMCWILPDGCCPVTSLNTCSVTAWRRVTWLVWGGILAAGDLAVALAAADTLWLPAPASILSAAASSYAPRAVATAFDMLGAPAAPRRFAAAAAAAAVGVSPLPVAAAACACGGSAAACLLCVTASVAVTAAAAARCSATAGVAETGWKCLLAAVWRMRDAERETESSPCICGTAKNDQQPGKLRLPVAAYSRSRILTPGSSSDSRSSSNRRSSSNSRGSSNRRRSSNSWSRSGDRRSGKDSCPASGNRGSSSGSWSSSRTRRTSGSSSRSDRNSHKDTCPASGDSRESSVEVIESTVSSGSCLNGSASRNASSKSSLSMSCENDDAEIEVPPQSHNDGSTESSGNSSVQNHSSSRSVSGHCSSSSASNHCITNVSNRSSSSMSSCGGRSRVRPSSSTCGGHGIATLAFLVLLLCNVQEVSAGGAPICAAGTYYSAAAASCLPCPADRYAPAAGLTDCMPCPQQATTLGKTGCSTLLSCACPADYYLNVAASICSSCPLPSFEFYCPGNITTENFATQCSTLSQVAAGGWWYGSDLDWPAVYQKCPVKQACIDGCGACREGHTGKLCQMCVSGWTRNFFSPLSTCSECPPTWQLLLRYFACAVGLTVAVTLCCFCTHHAATQRICGVPDDERSAFVPALKIFLSFLIVWGVYGLQADVVNARGAATDSSLSVAVAVDPSASTPSYFLQYVSAARNFLLLFVAGQGFDCWIQRSAMSPIYLFTWVALVFPLVVVGLLLLLFSLYFLVRKRQPPPIADRLLLEFARAPWPHLLGERLTGYFSAAVSVFLFFWVPQATVYFASAFQCTTLASGEKVQLFDPNVACGGLSYANATQVALPGAALGSVGVPVGLLLVLLYYVQLLEEPRYVQIFIFAMDFYRTPTLFWEPLRLLLLCALVYVAQHPFTGVKASLLATLLALFASVFAFARPFIPENTPPWSIRLSCGGRKRRQKRSSRGAAQGKNHQQEGEEEDESFSGKTIKVPRSKHLRELLAWIAMALLFELDAVRISLPEGGRRRVTEGAIIVLCSVTQLLLLLWLLVEVKEILWPNVSPLLQRYCRCFYASKQRRRSRQTVPAAAAGEAGRLVDAGEGGELLVHQFLRKDELFFADAVRLAPFPEEALAQLQTLLTFERFHSADLDDAAGWLLQQGHIELQGQALHAAFPRISAMYSDVSYDFPSGDFTKEMQKLLRKVAVSLNIDHQVRERQAAAAEIRQLYSFVPVDEGLHGREGEAEAARGGRGGAAAAEAAAAALAAAAGAAAEEEEQEAEAAARAADVSWREVLGGETAADVQLRWLRLRMHPEEREATVKKSQFTLIFPSAAPVARQDELRPRAPSTPPVPHTPNIFERLAEYAFGRKESLPRPPPPPRDPLDIRF